MGSTYFLVVSGPMPSGFLRAVQDQFDDIQVAGDRSRSVIECSVSDQPALRVLLTQIWDIGCEVLLVARIATESPRSPHGHRHDQHRPHPVGPTEADVAGHFRQTPQPDGRGSGCS